MEELVGMGKHTHTFGDQNCQKYSVSIERKEEKQKTVSKIGVHSKIVSKGLLIPYMCRPLLASKICFFHSVLLFFLTEFCLSMLDGCREHDFQVRLSFPSTQ